MSVDVAVFTVPGEPVSKERPRVVNGRTYTPTKTKNAEENIRWAFISAVKGVKVDSLSRFGVEMKFGCKAKHRKDIDNMVKTVLDALNKLCWADDHQVEEIQARKFLVDSSMQPLTIIRIYRLEKEDIL